MAERRPAGDILAGLDLHPLKTDDIPLDAVVLVKVLEDGEPRWVLRTTTGISTVEVIGALVTAADVERRTYADGWEDSE